MTLSSINLSNCFTVEMQFLGSIVLASYLLELVSKLRGWDWGYPGVTWVIGVTEVTGATGVTGITG